MEKSLLRVHGELSIDAKQGMSVCAAGSRVAVAFARLLPTGGRGANPLRILIDTFVFHAHHWARPLEVEEDLDLDHAAQYFHFAPTSASGYKPALLPTSPHLQPLPYEVYYKSVRIGAQESATMPVPMVWSAKLFADGLAVMREEHFRTETGRRFRLTHSYMFST